MSMLASRSPATSPSSFTPSSAAGGPFRSHRRSSTSQSGASSSTTSSGGQGYSTPSYYDAFSDASAIPTSPTSGSAFSPRIPTSPIRQQQPPRQPYSPNRFGPFSDSNAESYDGYSGQGTNGAEGEDDLGDRTITESPVRERSRARDYKGKAREEYDGITESTPIRHTRYNSHPDFDVNGGDEDQPDAAGTNDDSKRIEENLRRWAEKEKLRRAKSRSKQLPPGPPPGALVSEGIAAVSDLSRRSSKIVSDGLKRGRSLGHRPKPSGTQLLDGQDPLSEEHELQPPRSLSRDAAAQEARPPSASRAYTDSALSPPPPLSAISAFFPDSRVQRAVKTGSRFIEDLEDPEVQLFSELQQQPPQSTQNPFASPVSSPSRPPKNKLRVMIGGGRPKKKRTDSVASDSSVQTFDSNDTITAGKYALPGSSASSMISPSAMATPTKQYFMQPNGGASQTRLPYRIAGNYGDERSRRQAGYSDDEGDELEIRQVGWLEWLLCCGCFRSSLTLDGDEEQAGRTFPE